MPRKNSLKEPSITATWWCDFFPPLETMLPLTSVQRTSLCYSHRVFLFLRTAWLLLHHPDFEWFTNRSTTLCVQCHVHVMSRYGSPVVFFTISGCLPDPWQTSMIPPAIGITYSLFHYVYCFALLHVDHYFVLLNTDTASCSAPTLLLYQFCPPST